LVGNQYPFIVNLEPKKIGPKGDVSEGMMLAGVEKLEKEIEVSDGEKTDEKPVLLNVSEKVPNGTPVQ
jgi:tRNA-binding EMAP/Myf-like protein